MNEVELIQKLKRQDREALKILYSAEGKNLLHFLIGFGLSESTAEDLCHDLFVDLFQSIHKFRGQSSLKTWLFGMAKFKALEGIRKQKRRDQLLQLFPFLPSNLENSQHKAKSLLDSLEADLRALLWMKEVEGFSIAELAGAEGISESALKSKLHRAKQKLKNQEKE